MATEYSSTVLIMRDKSQTWISDFLKIALNETNLNKIPIDFYVKKLCALDQQSFKQLPAAYM